MASKIIKDFAWEALISDVRDDSMITASARRSWLGVLTIPASEMP